MKKSAGDIFALIEGVGDGHCFMREVISKNVTKVSYSDFKDGWKLVMDSNELKDAGAVPHFRETLADSNESIQLQRAWSRVQHGLQVAQMWVDSRHPLPLIEILTKPNKRVFVGEPVKAHGLFLLPHSSQYVFESSKNKKAFQVEKDWIESKELLCGKPLYIKPQWQPVTSTVLAGAACTEPFWAVRKVNRAEATDERGTVELTYLQTKGSTITEFKADEKVSQELAIRTPCLTNTVDLSKGDELVWLADFAVKRKLQKPVRAHEKKQKVAGEVTAEF